MSKSFVTFDIQIQKVIGSVRHFDLMNQFSRRSNSLMYYWNNAEELSEATLLVGNAKLTSNRVFCLLAGLSIELLLKGILLGLQDKFPNHHRIQDLSNLAGISSTVDDVIILELLSEYVIWASKYPTPKDEVGWLKWVELTSKQRHSGGNLGTYFISEREISLGNYQRLWEKYASYFWQVHEVVF